MINTSFQWSEICMRYVSCSREPILCKQFLTYFTPGFCLVFLSLNKNQVIILSMFMQCLLNIKEIVDESLVVTKLNSVQLNAIRSSETLDITSWTKCPVIVWKPSESLLSATCLQAIMLYFFICHKNIRSSHVRQLSWYFLI